MRKNLRVHKVLSQLFSRNVTCMLCAFRMAGILKGKACNLYLVQNRGTNQCSVRRARVSVSFGVIDKIGEKVFQRI